MEDAAPARRADPLAWAVFAVLAVVYRWGRCPTFGPGDSPGVVYRALYAPGADPLAWLGRAVSRLPFDPGAPQVNALSGLFHAGAAALLFSLLRRLGLKRLPALAAAALLAFLHQYWYYALVAGHGPAALFGMALAAWGVVAWKEEGSPWPLFFAAGGSAAFSFYARRAVSLVPAEQWWLALLAGLLIQRLDLLKPRTAAGFLAGALLIGASRPYDARRHNPSMEWALAALASVGPRDSLVVGDPGLRDAVRVAAAATGRADPFAAEGGDTLYDAVTGARLTGKGFAPDGLLIRQTRRRLPQAEVTARAAAVLGLPALDSVGRRDLPKYGFTGETVLYAQYRAVLSRYRAALGSGQDGLRTRIDRRLAEYGPGPASQP